MTHDPLCPYRDMTKWRDICPTCDLIARVREDERVKPQGTVLIADLHYTHQDGYAAALRDAVKAVVNCDDYPNGDNMLLVDAYRYGLEAAREAIEALGGER